MKIFIACLLCLAMLLVGFSVISNFSDVFSEKESVKDTTVDKDQNDKDETPSGGSTDEPADEPTDEPTEEVPAWTEVELTAFVDEDYTSSLLSPIGSSNYFKFTVEETGVYSFNPIGMAQFAVWDYSTKGLLFFYADEPLQRSLAPGEYVLGCAVDYDIEAYRYMGDFSEFEQSGSLVSLAGDSYEIYNLDRYSVLKLVCDNSVSAREISFKLNVSEGDPVVLDVIKNDGNGTLYIALSTSVDYQISALFVNISDFESDITCPFEAYGVILKYYEDDEVVIAKSDLTPLSMGTSVETELESEAMVVPETVIDEPEVPESSEIVSWSNVDGQEIVEYSDGRTFINGVEVPWSDVIIVG